jgi:hypothetical protein
MKLRIDLQMFVLCITGILTSYIILNYLYNSSNKIHTSTLLPIHIVLIFDHNRLEYAMQAIRSSSYYSKHPIIYHLVIPPYLESTINELTDQNYAIHFYDNSVCEQLANPVLAFSNVSCHISSHCKIYLAYIIPYNITKVLYIDNDVTATQEIYPCYEIRFSQKQFIGMGPDMGDICQLNPDICWPMSFEWTTPDGKKESYQFNSGVILMDLEKMRSNNFIEVFRETIIRTARTINFKKAPWGEQDFINSFLRIHPKTLKKLPCGCNYQYVGVSRHIKCPKNQPVYLAHGWRIGVKRRTNNPYNKLFYYFKLEYMTNISTPTVPLGNELPSVEPEYTHNYSCPHQSYKCLDKQTFESKPTFYRDTVFVITRTSGRRSFFTDCMLSVRDQTHPFINHLVIVDDNDSKAYLDELNISYTSVDRPPFDYNEPCRLCNSNQSKTCAKAPSLEMTNERKKYFDCYCNTSYPINTYFNYVQNKIALQGLSGWIIYLDDDNMFSDRFSVSEALAHATSRDQVLIWRSYLKRVTPSNQNWKRIVMGDIDTSGFMFHSNYMNYTRWNNKKCADYRTIVSLSKRLDQIWIDKRYVLAHPLQQQIGQRNDMKKLTIIITSCRTTKNPWIKSMLMTYTSKALSSIVHNVILIWNNPYTKPPKVPHVTVVNINKNFTINEWIKTLDHIETDAVLRLEDDIQLDKSAIICMMSYWLKNKYRLVGPFSAHSTKSNNYSLKLIVDKQEYSVILPRAIIMHRMYLKTYYNQINFFSTCIKKNDACLNIIALNIAATKVCKTPPLRVLLQPQTVLDYKTCLKKYPNNTNKLYCNKDITKIGSKFMKWIIKNNSNDNLMFTDYIGACGFRGVKKESKDITEIDYLNMMKPVECIFSRKVPPMN